MSSGMQRILALCAATRAWDRHRRLPSRVWDQHGHLMAVGVVHLAVFTPEIPLFEPDRDEDVRGRSHGEQQMREGHRGGRPEHGDPTHVEGVTHEAVRSRRDERERRVLPTLQVQPDLAQSEQVEVLDQECGEEDEQPATGVDEPLSVCAMESFLSTAPDLSVIATLKPVQLG